MLLTIFVKKFHHKCSTGLILLDEKCPYSEIFWSECGKIWTRKTQNTTLFKQCTPLNNTSDHFEFLFRSPRDENILGENCWITDMKVRSDDVQTKNAYRKLKWIINRPEIFHLLTWCQYQFISMLASRCIIK